MEEVERAKEELKEARKEWKRERKRREKEWWDGVLLECERASGRGDLGAMYKGLKKLGGRGLKKVSAATTITKEEFRDHFAKVSAERFENPPEEIYCAVDESEDLRLDPRTQQWRVELNAPSEREEVLREMDKMRDGAPGEDGAMLRYIVQAGGQALDEIVELVRYMWMNAADSWEDALKRGLIIPLFKKGDRNNPNNYRGVSFVHGQTHCGADCGGKSKQMVGGHGTSRRQPVRVSKWSVDSRCNTDSHADSRGFCGS